MDRKNSDKSSGLMPEDVQRTIGRDAQRNNIYAAKMLSEVVKTTLGPKGMDKMLVSPNNEITVTNDGVTILDEMRIEHPAAKMMVEVAQTQETEIGDGTTSAVMVGGKLLENAEKLLDSKIHPTVIVKGYKMAAEKAQEILKDIAFKITPEKFLGKDVEVSEGSQDQEQILRQIAMTAMTGKGAEDSKEKLAEIIVNTIKQIYIEGEEIDLNDIKMEKVKGESIKQSELVSGVVFDKEKVSHEMPSKVGNSKIALLDTPLEMKNPDLDTKVSVSSAQQIQDFVSQEEKVLKDMVQKLKEVGANVVFCQKGIDDFAQYLLAREGIYACRRVAKSDMEKLSKATEGKIVSNLNELDSYELGSAEEVKQGKHGESSMTYVSGCKNPKALSILIHGGTDHVLDEVERAMRDGLGDVVSVLKSRMVVLGGGGVEVELSKRLREFAQSLSGREQLAVEEFANALEFIPMTLAENAGLDPIDILTELKSQHDSGERNYGLNLFRGKAEDVFDSRIIEPYNIKQQALDSASEVATMILRIDDVIASDNKDKGNMQST
ncbi:MAG: thermosome subunit alpha, partial [Candidatus Pacearchaeota archaeon]